MKVFFDTSVIVAAAVTTHPHHDLSFPAFRAADSKTACCGAHTMAEVYATLTRLPGKHRVTTEQALTFLDEMEARLEIVFLNSREYRLVIEEAAKLGILGGTIYDALLGQCAVKAGATKILTWNVSNYQRLGREVASRVQTP